MHDDELEPGQDDLVRRDSAASKLMQKVMHPRSGVEDLYTDHRAGDPSSLTPPAEKSMPAAAGTSPVVGTWMQRLQVTRKRVTETLRRKIGRKPRP